MRLVLVFFVPLKTFCTLNRQIIRDDLATGLLILGSHDVSPPSSKATMARRNLIRLLPGRC